MPEEYFRVEYLRENRIRDAFIELCRERLNHLMMIGVFLFYGGNL